MMRVSIFFLLPLLLGCTSGTLLQDANIVDPAAIRLGIGASYLNSYGPLPECSGRIGVFRNLDLGIKYGINYVKSRDAIRTDWNIHNFDVRYQLINIPLKTMIGIGLSNFVLGSYPRTANDVFVFTVQPFVLVGQKNWYFAIRPYYSFDYGIVKDIPQSLILKKDGWSTYALTIGGSIPIAQSRILLELNYFRFFNKETIVLPAVGLQADL
jgi:hypothetical protein